MDQEVVVHVHNGILLSYKNEHIKKNEHIWISSNEVDQTEPIVQSEVSQKEKHKCCILAHI